MGAALNLQVRSMTRQELGLALDWADREGWNPGLNDGDYFHAADADGFLIGCLGGEPVACISSVRYGKNYGFIGFYIVRPELRGRGYGMRMWQAGMTRLADRVVGLDGVTAQQNNYKRSGFVLAHCNIRFGGLPILQPFRTQDSPGLTAVGNGRFWIMICPSFLMCAPGSCNAGCRPTIARPWH